MLNNNKMGKFLQKMRKEKNLSQDEIADKLYISRQAVSNWENGKTAPNIDNIADLANIFDISVEEIFAGESIGDKKTLNDIFVDILKLEMKKSRKIMIVAVIIIIILLVSFFVYYFINYYNNIVVYDITAESNNYVVRGVLNKSVNKIYFNLEIDKVPSKMCLEYNKDDIQSELFCSNNSNFIVFEEFKGYDEIIPLSKVQFEDYLSNLYLVITNDDVDKIKVNFEKDYQNNDLLFINDGESRNDNEKYKLEESSIPEKIRNEFEYSEEENIYYLNLNENNLKIEIIYYGMYSSFVVEESRANYSKQWNYDNNKKELLSYFESKDNKIVKKLYNFADIDKDKSKKEVYDYFKNNYLDKYLN